MISYVAQINSAKWRDFDLLARMLALLFAARSTFIATSTWRPEWDEMNYLHRAVCVNRTLFDWDWRGIHDCMLGSFKSPILMLVLLPAGRIGDQIELLRTAPMVLSICNFFLLFIIAFMTWRLLIPLAAVLVAAIALVANPLTHVGRGAVMIDTSLGLVVTIACLLFALETTTRATCKRSAAFRGLAWGIVGTAGMMSKMTFGYFAVLLFIPLPVIVWHHEGLRNTVVRILSCVAISIPGLIVFALYGHQYFWNALRSVTGPLAQAYADNLTLREYIFGQITEIGFAGPALLVMGVAAIITLARRRAVDWTVLYLLLVLAGYFWITSTTVNRDVRFLLPVWIALPWTLVLVWRKPGEQVVHGTPVRDFALAGLVSALLVLPSLRNYDLSTIKLSRNVLRAISADRPARILTGNDSNDFNIESMLLAYELEGRLPAKLSIDTLVYDEVNGRTLEQSLDRLRAADFVLFRIPLDSAQASSWPNTRYQEFLGVARAEGKQVKVVGSTPLVHIYAINRESK